MAPRDTNTILFNEVLALAKASGHYAKAESILDYALAETYHVRQLTSYGFDFVARVVWGRNEGVYIDCYLEGEFDQSQGTAYGANRLSVGTFKTLHTSVEAFKAMGELAGLLTYYARDYVDRNIDRYTPPQEQTAKSRDLRGLEEEEHEGQSARPKRAYTPHDR